MTGGLFNTLKRISAVIAGLTVLAVGGTLCLGKWVLSVMEQIMGRRSGRADGTFLGIYRNRAGRRFYAFANLMYYALVIMRRQKTVFSYTAQALWQQWSYQALW